MNSLPNAASRSRWPAERGIPLLLVLFALTTRLAFLYRGGTGDADAMVMAGGMARSLAPGVPFTESLVYGRQIGPGIYLLFRLVSPLLAGDPSRVLPFLNALGVFAASCFAWPLCVVFQRSVSRPVAAAATVLVLTTPLVWEAGTHFHPVTSAAFLLGLALLAWPRIGPAGKGLAWGAITALLGAAALLMWAEVALVFPAFLAGAALSNRRRRDLAVLAGLTVFAAATFLAVVLLIQSHTPGTPTGLMTYIRRFVDAYFQPRAVPRSLVWTFLAMGAGTVALTAVRGVLVFPALRRAGSRDPDDGRRLVMAALWVAVPYFFWLSNPVPLMRHFYLVVPGVVWLLTRTLPRRIGVARLTAGLLILVAVNLLLPEGLYRAYNRTHPANPKYPHGTFFNQHEVTRSRIARYHALVAGILREAGAGGGEPLVQVDWEGLGYVTYGLAVTPGFDPAFTVEPIAPGLAARRCAVGSGHLRLVATEAPPAEAGRPALVERFRRARAAGETVFVSKSAAQALGIEDWPGLRVY